MFTGIIEEIGKITSITRNGNNAHITIGCKKVLEGTGVGDSIAVNGVCLTVTEFSNTSFSARVSSESLSRTSLRLVAQGSVVNLERAMALGGRLGGHIVLGHVDGIGRIIGMQRQGDFWTVKIFIPDVLRKYIAEKGSVSIDGISLTVAHDYGESFDIAVIPATYNNTNLSTLKVGDNINLEADVIARYTEKLLKNDQKEDRLKTLLEELG